MVILAFAALLFGVFLGRFMTNYSIAPGCCFAIIVGLAVIHMPPLALIIRLSALVVTVQLGYLAGLAPTGFPTIRKARRPGYAQLKLSHRLKMAGRQSLPGGVKPPPLNAHSPQCLKISSGAPALRVAQR
jgi:hypothetical protein